MKFDPTDINIDTYLVISKVSKFLIILTLPMCYYGTLWLLLLMSSCFLVALYHMTVLNWASCPSRFGSCCTITKSESSTKKYVSFTQLFSIFFLVKSQHFKNIRQNIVGQKLSLIVHLSVCVSFIQFCSEKFSSKSISIFL